MKKIIKVGYHLPIFRLKIASKMLCNSLRELLLSLLLQLEYSLFGINLLKKHCSNKRRLC